MSVIRLPWPPSVNRYWRSVNGRAILSAEGRNYRALLEGLALTCRWPKFGERRVSVRVEAHPPDKRRRDLDNLPKAIFDGLTHCGVWADDSQIDYYSVERMPSGGGVCVVHISEREC